MSHSPHRDTFVTSLRHARPRVNYAIADRLLTVDLRAVADRTSPFEARKVRRFTYGFRRSKSVKEPLDRSEIVSMYVQLTFDDERTQWSHFLKLTMQRRRHVLSEISPAELIR